MGILLKSLLKNSVLVAGIVSVFFLFSPTSYASTSVSYLQSTSIVATQSTFSFAGENFGTASGDRVLIVVVRGIPFNPGDDLVSSITIGGVSATIHANTFDPDAGPNIAIASAPVPTGTSGTVSVTYAGNNTGARISLYRATGIGTGTTVYDTATNLDDVVSMSIDVPSGGILVAGGNFEGSGAITTVGVTEDDDTTLSTRGVVSGSAGPLTAEINRTVSFDGTAGNASGAAVSWDSGGSSLFKPPNNLGLVGYWPFNEATSTQAGDFSGNGKHGTLSTSGSGLPLWASGKRGGALEFDGTDEYVAVGSVASAVNSISFWMKADDTTSRKVIDLNGTQQIELDGSSNVTATSFTSPTVYVDGSSGSATVDTGWRFVVITTGTGVNASAVDIGRVSTGYFDGKIDDVRMYNRVLSATEVAALYGSGAIRLAASSKTLTQGSSLQSGLVGLWSFDGGDVNWTSPTAGVVYDGSGGNVIGTFVGLERISAPSIGKLGQALRFDGTDDHVTTTSNPLSHLTGTMAVWVRPSVATPAILEILLLGSRETNRIYLMRGTNGNLQTRFGTSVAVDSGDSLPSDTWSHAAMSWDNGNYIAYLNGVSVDSGTYAGLTGLGDCPSIGSYDSTCTTPNGPANFFSGVIDDARIYTRALSATEIKQLYSLGVVRIVP